MHVCVHTCSSVCVHVCVCMCTCVHLRLKRALELTSEKGASNWLTVLPVQEHGFSLHKTAFHDAIALRYGWDPI